MPRTFLNSRLHPNKYKLKIKQEVNNTKSNLSPHLQSLKQKLVLGNCFIVYKRV